MRSRYLMCNITQIGWKKTQASKLFSKSLAKAC